jgi:regulatory protein
MVCSVSSQAGGHRGNVYRRPPIRPSPIRPSPIAYSPIAHRLSPIAHMSSSSAYISALKLLARRELSEAQVRQRLARKGHSEDDIETAIERLKGERAIDDSRVAEAIARTETTVKRRGKLRVKRQIEQAGIAPATARQALDAVFEEVDDEALLLAALGRRLRGERLIEDDREFQRLYRYLAAQGFESDRILKVLNARRRRRSTETDDAD